jgi:chlorobactene glucosyltransferase
MATFIVIVVISTLGLILGLFLTYLIHSRYRLEIVLSPTTLRPGSPMAMISVVVPARNEADTIRQCVEDLLGQSYPNYEVIVVDDRSTDGTGAILEEILRCAQDDRAPLRVIQGEGLPLGWAGKPYALIQGVQVARGEWLCFVDADTFASPELLASAYSAAKAYQADMFTILTKQILGGFWEKVVLPVVFTGLSFGFPAERVNDPDKPDAIANGQFILIRRSVYDAIGGHGAVKDRIDEDRALAEVVKGAGYRLVLADGRALARTRMYASFSEMWEGWTKNIFVGLEDRLGLLFLGASLGLVGALGLPVWLLAGAVWWGAGGGLAALIVTLEAALLWIALLWARALVARGFEISPFYAFTLPLGALVFTAMMFSSTFKVLSGEGVTWKGRRYRDR